MFNGIQHMCSIGEQFLYFDLFSFLAFGQLALDEYSLNLASHFTGSSWAYMLCLTRRESGAFR